MKVSKVKASQLKIGDTIYFGKDCGFWKFQKITKIRKKSQGFLLIYGLSESYPIILHEGTILDVYNI